MKSVQNELMPIPDCLFCKSVVIFLGNEIIGVY